MKYDNLIVDGNNFLFRSFYSKRPSRIVNGLDVAPISQWLYMLKSVVERYSPKKIYFTWDKRLNTEAVNFRREIVQEYKENRIDTDEKQNVLSYMKIVQDFCDSLGIITVYPYDLEGDDVMFYLSKQLSGTSLIISSDRDLLQLVSDNVHQLIPTKNIVVSLDNFEDFTKVKPEMFVLHKAIMGDKSDNIAGLYKFGEVRAKALAEKIYSDGIHIVSEDNRKIIEDNLRIIDLKLSHLERPNEYKKYEEQLANDHPRFDSKAVQELFWKYELGYLSREMGTWRKLFVRDDDQTNWLDDPLSFITM